MIATPLEIALERSAAIRAELDKWVDGAVIAQKEIDRFGTTVAVVARTEGGATYYDILRAFALGDGVGVSADMQDGNVAGVASYLLTMLAKAETR